MSICEHEASAVVDEAAALAVLLPTGERIYRGDSGKRNNKEHLLCQSLPYGIAEGDRQGMEKKRKRERKKKTYGCVEAETLAL